MSMNSGIPVLAPFRVRSFRYQWPADLATSWAFEMESLVLSWYVLVETRSVVMFTVFASLQYIGTLFAPMVGVMGDRLGHRNILCAMRTVYATLAATLFALIATGQITPVLVMIIATLTGLVRPSDIGARYALIGATMPARDLMGATSLQRMTQDSARVAGALSGAGLVATLGMGWTYVAITAFYVSALFLVFRAGSERLARPVGSGEAAEIRSPWRDLKEGASYVWNTPVLLAVMLLAFLLNATAFPQFNYLLPVVAKEVYGGDQTMLGNLIASSAGGAFFGAIVMTRIGSAFRAGRAMLICCALWYASLILFAQISNPALGMLVLFVGGVAQTAGLIPMAAILMRSSDAQFRGRVMGIRMLAVYGSLPGLLIAGPLINHMGYLVTATLYCSVGLLFAAMIATRWRSHLWRAAATSNRR